MGEVRLFQICYEGELTVEVSHVMRRLGAEPNFDQSWQVFLPEGRHSAPLVRYLRTQTAADAKLLVACTQFTTARTQFDAGLASTSDVVRSQDDLDRAILNELKTEMELNIALARVRLADMTVLDDHPIAAPSRTVAGTK